MFFGEEEQHEKRTFLGNGELMLRLRVRNFKVYSALTLDALVPQDHFYRHPEAKLDLGFVREWVKGRYASVMGRSPIDLVFFF